MIELQRMASCWLAAMRIRYLGACLRQVESERRRIERRITAEDRSCFLLDTYRLENLGVEGARIRYLIETLRERASYSRAADAYRRQALAVDANCAAGHSPRLSDSRPMANDK